MTEGVAVSAGDVCASVSQTASGWVASGRQAGRGELGAAVSEAAGPGLAGFWERPRGARCALGREGGCVQGDPALRRQPKAIN